MFSKVDKVDLKILSILKSNGKKSHQDISGKLNFSRPAINKRVSKLEQENVIEGYEAIINYSQIGLPLDSYVLVDICTLDFNKSIERILNLREKGIYIESVYRITGNQGILLRVHTSSTEKFKDFHDSILKVEGVVNTNTMLVIQEEKNEFKDNYI
ncbi:MAG: Lrp/AsnC family transcriptional regulator [Peptoniphilus lacydonensis]|uniref:Lrp/AsnC family transcriptional regulator n=1 Tax=Peptoniphilus lacydonensis TaxID=1673725 RepID=UPI0029011701|nr:Lrp/AsnC family transcriptional regulator [Peptoniphilus lacydonensis]MDU1954852.1 Lrp/AsnC family transcriptional regulator [Peptoniphilus lacydonensis]MDU2114777.1 Lrp/AsnC family transcriptional regulator [Peptoniphilus lacydonensis]MDU5274341.1 Lrp/AsnC family transcriptional regulator [Peptoniphilus lacydonensis]